MTHELPGRAIVSSGVPNTDIAERTGTTRPTVLKWRGRYVDSGIDALDEDPPPSRAADWVEVRGSSCPGSVPPVSWQSAGIHGEFAALAGWRSVGMKNCTCSLET